MLLVMFVPKSANPIKLVQLDTLQADATSSTSTACVPVPTGIPSDRSP